MAKRGARRKGPERAVEMPKRLLPAPIVEEDTTSKAQFQFLDLPKELRVIVYLLVLGNINSVIDEFLFQPEHCKAMASISRFLDLPPELRVMVYESFTLVSWRRTLHQSNELADIWSITPGQPSSILLIRKSHPGIGLLTTCRLINTEAGPIFERSWPELEQQPARFILDLHAFWALTDSEGWLVNCCPSISTPPIESLWNSDDLPLEVLTFVKSSHSFLPRTKHQPLSNTRPFNVQLFLTQAGLFDQISMLNAVAAHMSDVVAWLGLSMAVLRQGTWPQMLIPTVLGIVRYSAIRVWNTYVRGIYPDPSQRPLVRLLPEPS